MRIGITTKLALLLSLLAMAAAAVTGLYIYRESRNLLVDSAKSKLLTSTQVLSRRIETTIKLEAGHDLRLLAGYPATQATLAKPDAALDDQLATLFRLIMEVNPKYFQMRLIGAGGYGRERVRVDRVKSSLIRVQGDDLREQGHFSYVSQTLQLAANALYMSGITINQERSDNPDSAERPSVQLAMPVMGLHGAALGVVVISIDVNGMFAQLTEDIPKDFRLYLTNGQGDFLIHPDNSKTFGFDKGRRVLVQDEFGPTADLIAGRVNQVAFASLDPDPGKRVIGAFVIQKVDVASSDDRFFLGLAQPFSEVRNEAQKIHVIIWKSVLAFSLFGIILAAFLARLMTKPINLLYKAMRRFARGEHYQELPLGRQDEIGDLARGFNQMQQQISQQIVKLDAELAERKKVEHRIIALANLRQQLLTNRPLEQKLQLITDEIVRIFDADFARVWVVRPGDICSSGCIHAVSMHKGEPICRDHNKCLHLVASSGRYTHTDGPHGRVPSGAYKIGRLIESGKERFITNDVTHDPQVGNHRWAAELGLVSFAGFGLFALEGTAIGVLGLFSRHTVNEEEVGSLTGMAATTSQVVQAGMAEEALIKARNEAEAATAAKSDFLARMSHEIRTPMNAVIGLTQLALRTELSPKQLDYLRKIRGSSQALLGIINDILDFSKIEAGRMSLEHIPFNLQDVLDNLANVITQKAEEKGLEILFSLDRQIPASLRGDPLRLGQVLINLAGNAVKFTEQGEVVIETRLTAKDEGQARILVSVRDTGIGMTDEQMENLFQSFYQADDSITRRFGGTGLGLAISRQLVEMMGGNLQVESVPGQGTTFFFEAPFEVLPEDGKPKLLAPQELCASLVLVVDDNATSREIMRSMLEGFGLQVETAVSGEQALQFIGARKDAGLEPYRLILMDWKMPVLDGIETARRIKQDPSIPNMPSILMITAFGREEVMKEAEDSGLDGFLIKPVNQSLLFNTILELFGYRDQSTAIREQFHGADSLAEIRGARVLLVEDNLINRQIINEFIGQTGLRIDNAVNGREALEMALSSRYDLVLMDIQMPEMDGLEATRRIRSQGLTDLPIIAMTAHVMAEDHERSLAAGMNGHLNKPIDTVELERVLLRWIPRGLRPEPPASPPLVPLLKDKKAGSVMLPEVAGLDTKLGLKLIGGYVQLYLELLDTFADSYRDAGEQVRSAIISGESGEAQRQLHAIKGAAASLGADLIAEIAQHLETALHKHDQPRIAELQPIFEKAITELCSGLELFFSQTPKPSDHI